MKTNDLKKIKLPLTKNNFYLLRNAIRERRIKWLDMSTDLMYAYQDFWRFHKFKKIYHWPPEQSE